MASDEPKGAIESADAAEAESEFVSFELLAPPGWKKKQNKEQGPKLPFMKMASLEASSLLRQVQLD